MGTVTFYLDYQKCLMAEEVLRREFPWISNYLVQRFPPGKLGERVVIVPDIKVTGRAQLEEQAFESLGVKVTILGN